MNQTNLTTALKAEREVELPLNIEDVKKGIEYIFTNASKRYTIKPDGRNELVGSYDFSISDRLDIYLMNVTVKAIEDKKTSMKLVCTAAGGSSTTTAMMESHISDYLKAFEKATKGESLESINKSGCGWWIAAIIIVIAIILWQYL